MWCISLNLAVCPTLTFSGFFSTNDWLRLPLFLPRTLLVLEPHHFLCNLAQQVVSPAPRPSPNINVLVRQLRSEWHPQVTNFQVVEIRLSYLTVQKSFVRGELVHYVVSTRRDVVLHFSLQSHLRVAIEISSYQLVLNGRRNRNRESFGRERERVDTNQAVDMLVMGLFVGRVVSTDSLPSLDSEDPFEVAREYQLLWGNATTGSRGELTESMWSLFLLAAMVMSSLSPKFYVALTGTSSLISGVILVLPLLSLFFQCQLFELALCLQMFEWLYYRRYGQSFIESISVRYLSPILGGSDTPSSTPGLSLGVVSHCEVLVSMFLRLPDCKVWRNPMNLFRGAEYSR